MEALAGDDELVFAAPTHAMEDLMVGLRYVDGSRAKLPRVLGMRPEPPFPDEYAEMRKRLGIKDNEKTMK